MQRKLLSWLFRRRSQSLTLISPPLSSAQGFSSSASLRSKKRSSLLSASDELDDPPFSPVPKTPKSNRKSNPKPSSKATGSGKDATLPFHSDLPFNFCYSYSETNPAVKPIGFREPPRFSPFGPGRLDRKWDGVSAPAGREEALAPKSVSEERRSILGDPLTEEEIEELVEKYRHSDCARQINLESY